MEHKLFLSRGISNNYFIQYSVKKTPINTDQIQTPYFKHFEFSDLIDKLRSKQGFPEDFYSVPVRVIFDEDKENDPIPQREKEEISALVNRLQIKEILKGHFINSVSRE